jgi:small-conductance mechanosensitive channel
LNELIKQESENTQKVEDKINFQTGRITDFHDDTKEIPDFINQSQKVQKEISEKEELIIL